eukprot:scaffold6638_cov76-Phaeocystis_antarctica.AAC.13
MHRTSAAHACTAHLLLLPGTSRRLRSTSKPCTPPGSQPSPPPECAAEVQPGVQLRCSLGQPGEARLDERGYWVHTG